MKKRDNVRIRKLAYGVIGCLLLVITIIGGTFYLRAQKRTSQDREDAQSDIVKQDESAAIALTTTENLIEKQEDGTTKYITTQENGDGTSFRRTITNSDKASLASDHREVFSILEIVPDYTFSYYSWLIGGLEPVSQDTMLHMANCNNGSVAFIFGADTVFDASKDSMYPITINPDAYRTLELTDYSSFHVNGTKATNGWLIVKDGSNTTTESGYFKYVGEGKGLYYLDSNQFTKTFEPVAEGTGSYIENVQKYMLASEPENSYSTYTANNYDMHLSPVFQGDSYHGGSYNSYGAYRYAYEASRNADGTEGEYIEKVKTIPNVYNTLTNSTGDCNLVYYEYVGKWNGVGTDIYAGQRCMPNFTTTMQPVVNGFGLYGNQFGYELDQTDVIYNPGNGQYKAQLWNSNPYYIHANGNYECSITNVTVSIGDTIDVHTAGTNVNQSSWSGGNYVWVPVTEEEAASLTYTSLADYVNDRNGTYIYMKNYTRPYCYYSKNGYTNNEFFKILCMDIMESLDTSKSDYVNYVNLTANQTLLNQSMNDFNHQYRIEVICLTPDQVTQDDLDKADLIYAGEDTPYDGGAYSEGVAQEWRDYEGLNVHARYIRDLSSFSLALSIYKMAITNMTDITPFMYSSTLAQAETNTNLGKTSNLYKLFMLFNVFAENPEEMREFIPSLQTDAAVKDYVNYIDETTGNMYIHCIGGSEKPTSFDLDLSACTWEPRNYWERNDFLIWESGGATMYYVNHGGKYKIFYETFGGLVDDIEDGDHSLMYHWYTRGFTMSSSSSVKVHILLQGWNQRLSVTITNAVQDYNGNQIIYVDEFDNGYPVEFLIVSTKGVSNVQVYFDLNQDGLIDDGDTVAANAAGSTLTAGADYSYTGESDIRSSFGTVTRRNIIVCATDPEGRRGTAAAVVIIREIPDLN